MNKAHQKLLAILLIIGGVIGLAVAAYLYVREPGPPRTVRPLSVDAATAPSSARPSPSAIARYSVPPTDPKYIAVPTIGVGNTPVLKLGILASGDIATPRNIYEAGWYSGSSLPGQPGAMFIYGHVSSWAANGVFYDLKKLKPGDAVTITRGDDRQFVYRVVTSKVYDYQHVDMRQALAPVDAGKPGLNLMTCAGKVIKGTSEFSERLVVFTTLDVR